MANLESTDDPDEESYSFDGASGSLDHVIANAAAEADGHRRRHLGDQRQRDRVQPVQPLQLRRHATSSTAAPFAASDHNPEIVGINAPDASATTDIQILGTNDFHGRIANDPAVGRRRCRDAGRCGQGAAAENPNTVFAAAGDLIGASTFESFIQNDKPTIDALNEAGLEVSSVGNHEFDQGYADLVDRVMAPYDADHQPEAGRVGLPGCERPLQGERRPGAARDAGPRTSVTSEVGFVGVVTEHLPELVSPGGIADIEVTDIVEETNAAADDLVDDGADIVVMLVHEGSPNTNCATMDDDPTSDFGSIITGVNENVDAIVSGHTHLEYNCSFPVGEWAGRDVTERPVVSAGQYGAALNQIVFTVDDADRRPRGQVPGGAAAEGCTNGGRVTNYPVDPSTQAIVDEAVADAAVLGAHAVRSDRRSDQAVATWPTGRPRTAVASPRWATWSPRSQRWQTSGAGGRLGADRVHEPGRPADRHARRSVPSRTRGR